MRKRPPEKGEAPLAGIRRGLDSKTLCEGSNSLNSRPAFVSRQDAAFGRFLAALEGPRPMAPEWPFRSIAPETWAKLPPDFQDVLEGLLTSRLRWLIEQQR